MQRASNREKITRDANYQRLHFENYQHLPEVQALAAMLMQLLPPVSPRACAAEWASSRVKRCGAY
jgi:hypothetical protein